jgi:hypothetical protein
LSPDLQSRLPLLVLGLVCLISADSCAVPIAPGYSIEKQQIEVHFLAQPQPHLEVTIHFDLLNSGNQPLEVVAVRMPAGSVYDLSAREFQIGGQLISAEPEKGETEERVILRFPNSWKLKERREVRISYKFQRGITKSEIAAFAAEESFYVSPGGWLPVLLPPNNAFSEVKGPLKLNSLVVRAPQDFQVRGIGELKSRKKDAGETLTRFQIAKRSVSPFVVAGKYVTQQVRVAGLTVNFWSHQAHDPRDAQSAAQNVAKIVARFDEILGPRPDKNRAVWMIESPASNHILGLNIPEGGRATALSAYGPIPDTALLDSEVFQPNFVPIVAEKLIPSWSGLGPSVEADSLWPMTDLNAYVATLASLSNESPGGRARMVFSLVQQFQAAKEMEAWQRLDFADKKSFLARPETDNTFKGQLFFFALEDQFGSAKLHKALRHIVEARRGEGYTLNDLIGALEQELRQSVTSFTRSWLKHPGLPEEFRRRYEGASTAATAAKDGAQ